MQIDDFFDPFDIVHIKAYKHLCETGSWPEGFIPSSVEFFPAWQLVIASKLADCWVTYKIVSEQDEF